jgi:hypothetical protein
MLRLISINEGFKQYKKALEDKNYNLIDIWQKNFDKLVAFLLYEGYKLCGLNRDKIFIYTSTFIKFYNASEYISDDYIRGFLSSYWSHLESAEILTNLS